MSMSTNQKRLPQPRISVERDVHHSLREYAERTGATVASVVATAVAAYLDSANEGAPSFDRLTGSDRGA